MMKRSLTLAVCLILCLCCCIAGLAEVDLQSVMDRFELSEDMMPLTLADLNDIYFLCIDEADVAQCAAAVHTSGINCDEIILFEATDEEAAGRLKAILDARYQAKLDEMENYLPEQFAIIQQCGVEQNGNFVSMIVSPDAQRLVALYEESIRG